MQRDLLLLCFVSTMALSPRHAPVPPLACVPSRNLPTSSFVSTSTSASGTPASPPSASVCQRLLGRCSPPSKRAPALPG